MYECLSISRYVLTVCMRGLCVRKGNKKRDSPPQTPQKGQTYPRVLSCFLNCTVRLRHLKLLISSISTQSFHDGIFDPLHRCIRWEVFLNTLHWNFDFRLLIRLLVRLFFGQYRLYPFFGKNPLPDSAFSFEWLVQEMVLLLLRQYNRKDPSVLPHRDIIISYSEQDVYQPNTEICHAGRDKKKLQVQVQKVQEKVQ